MSEAVYRVGKAKYITYSRLRKITLTWTETEVSRSNRAGCQATHCKKEQVKIQKGELRQGVLITINEQTSWKWRHWYVSRQYSSQITSLTGSCRGCVTPTVLNNWVTKAGAEDGDMDLIDGFDELPEECQERVRRSLKELHVDDEDWNGVCGDCDRRARGIVLTSTGP
jgi:hypothetical protein